MGGLPIDLILKLTIVLLINRHVEEGYFLVGFPFSDEAQRHNKLPVRLIGDQAIAQANFSYRLIDGLKISNESPAQKLKRLALGKIAEFLRNAGALFNKIEVSPVDIGQLKEFCTLHVYFNLYVLFFEMDVNVTVWAVPYAIPYHASKPYDNYKVGYGIISLQAKEAKHSGVKNDLDLTNRSNAASDKGKWWQVMRTNYVRAFYLPEHRPMPSTYTSHYKSRLPSHINSETFCNCGRAKEMSDNICMVCVDARVYQFCALKVMRDFQIKSLAMCTSGCTHKEGRPIKMLQIAENYTPRLRKKVI